MGRPRELSQEERQDLMAKGYKPVEVWVLDTENPGVRAEIKRQCEVINNADKQDDIFEWLESVHAEEEADQ